MLIVNYHCLARILHRLKVIIILLADVWNRNI